MSLLVVLELARVLKQAYMNHQHAMGTTSCGPLISGSQTVGLVTTQLLMDPE